MGNHTVKKGKNSPAGLEDKTILVCTGIKVKNAKEIGEKAKKETIMAFDLDANGKLQRTVIPEEYVVIKAYPNKEKNKDKSKDKKKQEDRDEDSK